MLSVRVWLAGLGSGAGVSRAAYVAWGGRRVAGHPTRLIFGEFTCEALDANRQDRRAQGTDVPPGRLGPCGGLERILAARGRHTGEGMPFAEILRVVLAGTFDEVEAARQP